MGDNEDARMAAAAGQAARAGRWAEAEAIWTQLQTRTPDHPEAAFSLGHHALQRGDAAGAMTQFAIAQRADPKQPVYALALAQAAEATGNFDAQHGAINAALAADAYFLPALVAKAIFYERHGRPKAAALMYRNVLRVAPPQAYWPADLAPALAHATERVNHYTAALEADLLRALGDQAPLSNQWREAVSIMAGRSKPYHADCNQLTVPRLPAQPFFDRAQFPWASRLEAETAAIRKEMLAVLNSEGADWQPYIRYNPGEPVNQWQALNHSTRWNTFHLYRAGQPVAENLARCPQTAKALAAVEMAEIAGLCPNAMFSVLAPHTEIPPHHGETNARLVVHLPLVVPPGCLYRVGYEERRWTEGELLIFDDTIEHTARNDGDQFRVVLIFDVWNPLLSGQERQTVKAMAAAARAFHASETF